MEPVSVPIVVGSYATFGVLAVAARALEDSTWEAAAEIATVALALVGLGLALASLLARLHRYFRRRLWPRLDDDAPATAVGAR